MHTCAAGCTHLLRCSSADIPAIRGRSCAASDTWIGGGIARTGIVVVGGSGGGGGGASGTVPAIAFRDAPALPRSTSTLVRPTPPLPRRQVTDEIAPPRREPALQARASSSRLGSSSSSGRIRASALCPLSRASRRRLLPSCPRGHPRVLPAPRSPLRPVARFPSSAALPPPNNSPELQFEGHRIMATCMMKASNARFARSAQRSGPSVRRSAVSVRAVAAAEKRVSGRAGERGGAAARCCGGPDGGGGRPAGWRRWAPTFRPVGPSPTMQTACHPPRALRPPCVPGLRRSARAGGAAAAAAAATADLPSDVIQHSRPSLKDVPADAFLQCRPRAMRNDHPLPACCRASAPKTTWPRFRTRCCARESTRTTGVCLPAAAAAPAAGKTSRAGYAMTQPDTKQPHSGPAKPCHAMRVRLAPSPAHARLRTSSCSFSRGRGRRSSRRAAPVGACLDDALRTEIHARRRGRTCVLHGRSVAAPPPPHPRIWQTQHAAIH
eukprot:365562-Chlamydomonas_euryale.AAC.2